MTQSVSFDDLCDAARKQLKAGQPQEALKLFEEARQLNDLDADVHEGLATARYLLGEYAEASVHYERVTRLDARRGVAWINLGAIYNRLGSHQKAAEVLRRAVQIERRSSIGFYNLGIAYKHLKQWTMAIPAYREAIRLDPRMADAYLNLGNVYLEMSNFAQAIAQFRKALEINPQFEKAQRGIEKADSRMKSAKSAVSPFGRLVDANKAMQGVGDDPQGSRQLSDEERLRDRRILHELIEQTQADLQELANCLHGRIEPVVRTLNRLLTHQKTPQGGTIGKSEALKDFAEARTAFAPRLLQFRRIMQQIRDHEASVK